MNKHQVIFLWGLGDKNLKPWIQQILKHLWKIFGLDISFVRIGWADSEPFDKKLSRITNLIDSLHKQHQNVSLVGISAGASAALNAYEQRKNKVNKVVYICGKFNNPQAVNPRFYIENPAFRESLAAAQGNLKKLTHIDKAKMLSVRPLYDGLVPVGDTKIPGVEEKIILTAGHIPSILAALIFYSRAISKELV